MQDNNEIGVQHAALLGVDLDDVQSALYNAMHLFNDGDMEAAVEACKEILAADEGRPEPYFVLSIIAFRMNDLGQALQMAGIAHEREPDNLEYLQVIASLSARVGKLSDGVYYAKLSAVAESDPFLAAVIPKALVDFHKALAMATPSSHGLEGLSALNLNSLDKAVYEFSAEIRINPQNIIALEGLGKAALRAGQQTKAVGALQALIALEPDHALGMGLLSRALAELGRYAEAQASAMRAIRLADDDAEVFLQAMCALQSLPDVETSVLKVIASEFSERFLEENATGEVTSYKVASDREVHIGILSNAFYRSDTSDVTLNWFGSGPPANYKISGYQQSPNSDGVTAQYTQGCNIWRKVFDTDPWTQAMAISGDAIDLLLDLSQPNGETKATSVALTTCPIRVGATALPEPGLMPGITHVLSDQVLAPADTEMLLDGQELIVTQGSLFARAPYSMSAEPIPTPASETGILRFGAFAKLPQLSPSFAQTLGDVLRATPGSRLLLFGGDQSSEESRNTIREYFLSAGVADRVDFVDRDVDAETGGEHEFDRFHIPSAFWQEIDIFIDSSPICGKTELHEALWHGVPTLTQRGKRRASAVGASILVAAGRPNWVVNTRDELINLAANMAGDIDALSRDRAALCKAISQTPLFEGKKTGQFIRVALFEAAQQGRTQANSN